MLGRKGSIECGTKSILCLFLAFASYVKASNVVHEEFGCEFADKKYGMQRTNKAIPVFGNISTLKSTLLPTDNTDMFVDIVEPLQKKVFYEPNIMNDVSPFTEFVIDYKNSPSKKTLESFFNDYEVPFKPKEYTTFYTIPYTIGIRKTYDPVSYIIQEFHALKAYLAVTKKSVSPYLVSAYVDPIGIDFSALPFRCEEMAEKVSMGLHNLVQKRVQDHIAGIIKIEAGKRKGYILMDPGYANGVKLYHPFIVYVMEDGEPPHGEFITTNTMKNEYLIFATGGGKGSSYILVKHTKKQSETKYVVYYVAKSYCSFMENTVKANIMRFNHGIVARTTNGTKQAYQTFKISAKNKMNFPKSMENALDLPTKEITAITEEFKYIETNVIENRQMMFALDKLANILDLDKEQRLDGIDIRRYPEPVEEEPKNGKGLLQKMLCCIRKPKVDE